MGTQRNQIIISTESIEVCFQEVEIDSTLQPLDARIESIILNEFNRIENGFNAVFSIASVTNLQARFFQSFSRQRFEGNNLNELNTRDFLNQVIDEHLRIQQIRLRNNLEDFGRINLVVDLELLENISRQIIDANRE